MKKIYYLSTCSTCIRIINELELHEKGFEFQDIKTNTITPVQLQQMKEMSGDYTSLFSRRAMKYKSMDLAERQLLEDDYKNLILEEYTFLKRPVIIVDEYISVGSAKKEIEKVKNLLANV